MAALRIGFIGLGQMGVPMVRNLLRAGFSVTGFDLNAAAVSSLAGQPGFSSAESAAKVAAGCDALILMLPDSTIVDGLLWTQKLSDSLKPGQILIDMGSSDPVCSRENAARLSALGIGFVDAPVSGGVRRAVDASLAIMIGGEADSVARVRPALEAMGKTLVHVGTAGAGHAVKALNNYVSASGLLAACEALAAAESFGIDPHLVNQVFNASSGKNNTTEHKVESFMLSGAFNSGFSIALMRKDVKTAQDFISRMGTPGGFADACLTNWEQAEQSLERGADHTAMYKHIKGT
jgi:3-hydroxyisobutyrate dehydrogenase